MKLKMMTLVIVVLLSLVGCTAQNGDQNEALPDTSVSAGEDNKLETNLVCVKVLEANDEFDYAGDSDSLFDGYEFRYNTAGELERIVSWSGYQPEEHEYKYIYEFYDSGKIKLAQRYENLDGQYEVQQELKFDENGLIYEQISYSGGVGRRAPDYNFYSYDENGNIIKDEHYYDLDEIDYVRTYQYNDQGELVESTFTKYGALAGHSVFYHHSNGYPAVEIEYDLNMNLTGLYMYSYLFEWEADVRSEYPTKVAVFKEETPSVIEDIMNSAQFPLDGAQNDWIRVAYDDARVFYHEEDALYIEVFQYEYRGFTGQQEEILLAKKKARIDVPVWGFHYDNDYMQIFW